MSNRGSKSMTGAGISKRELYEAANLELLLDWSAQQYRIYTANDQASDYYSAKRGYSFTSDELPHSCVTAPPSVRRVNDEKDDSSDDAFHKLFVDNSKADKLVNNPTVGVWKRQLAMGAWENSSCREEDVFWLQTPHLFIELAIPRRRNSVFKRKKTTMKTSIQDLTPIETRLYARQHIRAGYLHCVDTNDHRTRYDFCGRQHYALDWNYHGVADVVPKKWWIEWRYNDDDDILKSHFKKWAYATDHHQQHYYCEKWERIARYYSDRTRTPPILSLRRKNGDGFIIIIGDYFAYVLDRNLTGYEKGYSDASSFTNLIDLAVVSGDMSTARAWLSMQGGVGRIKRGWIIEHAIEYWKEGRALWHKQDVHVFGSSLDDCVVMWNNQLWDVYECSCDSIEDVRAILWNEHVVTW